MALPGPTEPNNPHDALFRKTFSRVEHAAAELQVVLPPELLSRIELETLRLAAGSYVDAELASSQSDLLFTVEVQGSPGLLYLLFEHQSQVDELMAFRMLKYVVRILDQHVTGAGGGRKALPLPVVVPVVLHHSATGWSAATRIEDLFDPNLVAQPGVAPYVPRLGFLLDDISQLSDEALARRALGVLPTLTLWALRDARQPGRILRSIARWASLIQALYSSDSRGEALLTLFRYLSLVADDLTAQALLSTLNETPADVKEALMTTLAERWKAEAKAEGKAEGEAKGKVKGARAVLLQLMGLKFGELPSADLKRIEEASEEQVLAWSARVLNAASVADILAD